MPGMWSKTRENRQESKGHQMEVKFVDLPKQYVNIIPRALKKYEEALNTGGFIGAPSFEDKFAKYNDVEYCVGVGSGTDALLLTLISLGIGPGDEVIVPANTYIATAFAVSHTGANPVFVDPNPKTYVIEANNIKTAITSRTKAIIPVHLYGYPVDMLDVNELARRYNLYVIEDCAQAAGATLFGRKVGCFGIAGCFSFYPTKNIGGIGQGGAVITNDYNVAKTVRELGNVGRTDGSWFDYSHIGFNSRLDAINAEFLELCLDELDEWNSMRRNVADMYNSELKEVSYVITPSESSSIREHVYHLYELDCGSKTAREVLRSYLLERGIGCSVHYPVPCHKQPMYSGSCSLSDSLADTLLSLPMHPNLTAVEVKYVCDCIKEFFED